MLLHNDKQSFINNALILITLLECFLSLCMCVRTHVCVCVSMLMIRIETFLFLL